MENRLLRVDNIDAFYGDAQALWDISFRVRKHRITALIGANGAGKSTLLKTISGLIRPRQGRITMGDRSLTELKAEDVVNLGISHVPEGRRLFSRLTVLENLELGAYPPEARPFLKESLDQAFDLFPVLKERTGQPAGTLSGGEQQMLAIARALMAKPTLLMLDEPSLGLAPLVVGYLFEIIQTLNRNGMTILLVEQNVHQTLEIADYAYVLKNGSLTMEGRAENLLVDSDFQQAFLGMVR